MNNYPTEVENADREIAMSKPKKIRTRRTNEEIRLGLSLADKKEGKVIEKKEGAVDGEIL